MIVLEQPEILPVPRRRFPVREEPQESATFPRRCDSNLRQARRGPALIPTRAEVLSLISDRVPVES